MCWIGINWSDQTWVCSLATDQALRHPRSNPDQRNWLNEHFACQVSMNWFERYLRRFKGTFSFNKFERGGGGGGGEVWRERSLQTIIRYKVTNQRLISDGYFPFNLFWIFDPWREYKMVMECEFIFKNTVALHMGMDITTGEERRGSR